MKDLIGGCLVLVLFMALAGALIMRNASQLSSAHAEGKPSCMRLVTTEQDSAGWIFIRVWEDTQKPGVTCYEYRGYFSCVYIPER